MPDGRTQSTARDPDDRRAAGLDPALFAALRRRLVGIAAKLLWRRDDAEDIAQEAFRIAAAGGPGPSEAGYEPWVLRTVINLCLNERRRKRPEPLADWMEPGGDESPDAIAARAERLERAREAIGKLPDQQRVALTLRAMEGMSYEEAAAVMAISPAAVRTHVHLARRRLVEMLG